jgi:hypothetical protein
MASIHFNVVEDVSRLFSAFATAYCRVTIRRFRRPTVYVVLFVDTLELITSNYKKILTQIAEREYQKKISAEYNSINLNIRTLCAVPNRNILKSGCL